MSKFLSRFFYLTREKYKSLLSILFLVLFASLLESVGIGMVGPFIAVATNPNTILQNSWLEPIYREFHFSSQIQFLLVLSCLTIMIFYIKSFLSFYAQTKIFSFGFLLQAELSTKLMRAYLEAPYTFHLERNSATFIQNIMGETDKFSNYVVIPSLTSISNALVTFALILLLIKTNAIAMVIIVGVVFISFLVIRLLKDRMTRWGKEAAEAQTEIIRSINHSLGGLKETRVIGCENYFVEQASKQVNRYGRNMSSAVSFSSLPRYMIESFLITFLVCFTILFINSNSGNQSLTAVLGIFALASIRLLPAAGNLVSSVNGMRAYLHSVDKLYFDFKKLEALEIQQNLISRQNLTRQARPEEQLARFSGQIVLDEVNYGYPNASKLSLNAVSLEIKKGQSIALIGKSGAGKTTLVDVILGLLIPQSGDIKVDGVSIYTNLRSWQNKLGYVPQSIFLIDDTLARNIAFGVPDHLIDWDKLAQAIYAAQLSDLVKQLPQGLETRVGERGVLLSGGQRQRVGIARALYHEREILVFDEATSALDDETESLVTESIKNLSGNKTMIIIAHRLSTVEHCDRIYLLEGGRIVKSGSYKEVVLEESFLSN
jgi:ABC-type multidrug transport system fused ATPase/permease subunit